MQGSVGSYPVIRRGPLVDGNFDQGNVARIRDIERPHKVVGSVAAVIDHLECRVCGEIHRLCERQLLGVNRRVDRSQRRGLADDRVLDRPRAELIERTDDYIVRLCARTTGRQRTPEGDRATGILDQDVRQNGTAKGGLDWVRSLNPVQRHVPVVAHTKRVGHAVGAITTVLDRVEFGGQLDRWSFVEDHRGNVRGFLSLGGDQGSKACLIDGRHERPHRIRAARRPGSHGRSLGRRARVANGYFGSACRRALDFSDDETVKDVLEIGGRRDRGKVYPAEVLYTQNVFDPIGAIVVVLRGEGTLCHTDDRDGL